MVFYIVYSYVFSYNGNNTKYIRGIYKDMETAIKRQIDICGVNHTYIHGKTMYGNNQVTFINTIPEEDCNIEIFTT